jgi:transposase
MALPESPSAGIGSGTASGGQFAAGDQCHSLCSEDGLPAATIAPRVSGLDGHLYYFSRWSCNGNWKCLHHLLRARLREQCGRHKHPTAGCLDSQSAKCTAVPGARGFDAGKLINGRKRHILVDTLGLLLVVVVTVAERGKMTVLFRFGKAYYIIDIGKPWSPSVPPLKLPSSCT